MCPVLALKMHDPHLTWLQSRVCVYVRACYIGVRDFMREGCEAVHASDPRALCVVGPRPYYKLWELSNQVLQPPGSNTLYTFDFFVPKHFVMSDTAKERERYCSHGDPNCLGSFFPAKCALPILALPIAPASTSIHNVYVHVYV